MTAKRTRREVERDARVALDKMHRAAGAATWCTLLFAAFAAWISYDAGDWRLFAGAAGLAAVILLLAHWVRRGSQVASVGLVATYAGAVAFIWLSSGQVTGALGLAFIGYRLLQGMIGSFDLAELRTEFAEVYEPRPIQAGDLYTVQQGGEYAVAKVLAFDQAHPDIVHIRLFGERHRERLASAYSREGKGADLVADNEGRTRGRTAYPHLPVKLDEFLRWLPALLRHEPVQPDELAGYHAWHRVQYPDANANIQPSARTI